MSKDDHVSYFVMKRLIGYLWKSVRECVAYTGSKTKKPQVLVSVYGVQRTSERGFILVVLPGRETGLRILRVPTHAPRSDFE